MRNLFLSLLFLVSFSFGTNLTVDPLGGGQYTTIAAAMTAAVAGDTISVVNGPHKIAITTKISCKKVLLRSASTGRDSLFAGDNNLIEAVADTMRVEGFYLSHDSTVTPTTYRYLVYSSSSYKGHKLKNCIVARGAYTSTGYRRGIAYFGSSNRGFEFIKCVFKNCNILGTTSSYASGYTLDTCLFLDTSAVGSGPGTTIKNTIFHSRAAENSIRGDSITIENCAINASGSTVANEFFSSDENLSASIKNVKITRCTFDSTPHNITIDGQIYSEMSNCFFANSWINSSSMVMAYGHASNVYDSIYQYKFKNNTTGFVPSGFNALSIDSNWMHHDNSISGWLMLNSATSNIGNMGYNDSAYNCVTWSTTANFSLITDTNKIIKTNDAKKLVIDTVVAPFINRRQLARHPEIDFEFGSHKYLSNTSAATTTTNSFSFPCSLAVNFHHDNKFYADSFWVKNTWWTGDTARVRVQIATDTAGTFTIASDDTIVAGQSATYTASGLNSGTTYYYRVMSNGLSNGVTSVADTTTWLTATTISNADTVKINYIVPNAGSVSGGDTVDIIGSFDSTGNNVSFGGTSPIIVSQNIKRIRIVTPIHASGSVNVIVSPSGWISDTIAFTYDTILSVDTVYVDSVLSAYTATYDPTTRLSTGGTDKGYPSITSAFKDITVGNTIFVRGGTYYGHQTIDGTKNGTSWVIGHYSKVKSYPGEWAILDGQLQTTVVLGDSNSNYDVASHRIAYWWIDSLEIKNARTPGNTFYAAGAYAAGIQINKGPFKITNCYIHDNYPTVSAGSENSGGIRGYHWTNAEIAYCAFKNNGGLQSDPNANGNCPDINVFSDYRYATTVVSGFTYNANQRQNLKIHDNYFMGGSYVGIKEKGAQYYRGGDSLLAYPNDYFKDFGSKIYNNILKGYIEGIVCETDFSQVHNNILDSCSIGITATVTHDSYCFYKIIMYNNTLINCYSSPTQFYKGHTDETYTTTNYDNYHGFLYNNIIDSGITATAWAVNEVCFVRLTSDSTYNFDSSFFGNNLSFRQNTTNTPKPILFGKTTDLYTITEFNTAYGRSAKHFTVATGDLYSSKYISKGTFSVSGDTTIADGGYTTHPYLSTTLPSYIGAVNPSDTTWVPEVLDLSTLGGGSTSKTPATITVQPESDTIKLGQTSTFSVTATGTGTLYYKLFKNNIQVDSNQTGSFNILSNKINIGLNTIFITATSDTIPSDTSNTVNFFVRADSSIKHRTTNFIRGIFRGIF